MEESINDASQLADLQALSKGLNDPEPIQTANNSMAVTKRKSVAELMARAKKSPFMPARTIEAACKQFADENKLTYASDYPVNLTNPFLKCEYDVLVIIFGYLARYRSFPLVANMLNESSIRNLRLTCKQMYAHIRVWMRSVLKNKVKELPCLENTVDELPSLTESIEVKPFQFFISPLFGIFEPLTTTFLLDAAFFPEAKPQEFGVEKRLALARLIKFDDFQVHQQEVRHIKLVVRKLEDARVFMEQLSYFHKLETFEVVIPTLQRAKANKREAAERQLWKTFWACVRACHPGRCCSCCIELPELKIRFSEADKGIAKFMPGPARNGHRLRSRQDRADKWYLTTD